MTHPFRRAIVLLSSGAIGTAPVAKTPVQAPNVFEIVVGSGAFAGTYKPPMDQVICMHAKVQKQFTVAWKNFETVQPKGLSDAAINIENPDAPGPRQGVVQVTFGPSDKHPTMYSVHIPAESKGPLTMKTTGQVVSLSFSGKTKDGIVLTLSATCKGITRA